MDTPLPRERNQRELYRISLLAVVSGQDCRLRRPYTQDYNADHNRNNEIMG